jgi:uncharacterized protein YceH (UPF0502 family)
VDLTAQHARVLACLIEKAETTPDSYPLTTNALRAACNQATNRDPVVDYTEREIDAAMLELRQFGLARTVKGSGHRVAKHKHVVDEALGLDGDELAVLAVLVLRGAQTHNEILTRTARYEHGPASDEAAIDAAIDRLAAKPEPFVTRLERRPGEREPRIIQCWVLPDDAEASSDFATDTAGEGVGNETQSGLSSDDAHDSEMRVPEPIDHAEPAESLANKVAKLETIVAEQRRRLDRIAAELGMDDN